MAKKKAIGSVVELAEEIANNQVSEFSWVSFISPYGNEGKPSKVMSDHPVRGPTGVYMDLGRVPVGNRVEIFWNNLWQTVKKVEAPRRVVLEVTILTYTEDWELGIDPLFDKEEPSSWVDSVEEVISVSVKS